jgi:multimeric flavodoxin WrbA
VLAIVRSRLSPRDNLRSVFTHRQGGAVQAALLGAAELTDTETEFVSLAGKQISPCNGCADCLDAGRFVISDDMTPLYDGLLAADALILGTPVYYG